jgi:hypothetical protein
MRAFLRVRKALAAMSNALIGNKELVEFIQSAVTIAAIIVGGIWTYRLLVEKRELQAHLNVRHAVVSRNIAQGVVWLHLSLSIENTGESLVSLRTADVRVQQILPLDPSLQTTLNDEKFVVPRDSNLVPWPTLCRYLAKLDMDIEPKETDTVDFDFFVPSAVKTVRIYSYLENAADTSKTRQIGWNLGTIYDASSRETDHGEIKSPLANGTSVTACRIDR